MSDLGTFFESTRGLGVLATADGQGRVNAAIYARPHLLADGSLAFIMGDRLTHENLKQNPHAAYLFVAEGSGYRGVRLHLTKVGESDDRELIDSLRRRAYSPADDERIGPLFLVRFAVDQELPLIGSGPER
jgi:hypothetical protein